MSNLEAEEVRTNVRDHYGRIASSRQSASCCAATGAPSCGPSSAATLGYGEGDAAAAPEGADLGLGCGNPTAIAALREGEVVLDLGSGAGFDSFIAARQVGATGRVIGVDMTAEMIARARGNARKIAAENIEFRLGEIEHLPVADASIDVILSNCVINLSPDKRAVFAEAFRVLHPGGRLAISDVVATAPIPEALRRDVAAHAACIAGAAPLDELRQLLAETGFADVTIELSPRSAEIVGSWVPGIERFVASATIEASKPGVARHAPAPSSAPSSAPPSTAQPACCAPSCCA
jgi:arsenite methyltransferase